MFFSLLNYHSRNQAEDPGIYLISDDWDDFGFITTFQLVVVSNEGIKEEIGFLNIGRFGMGGGGAVEFHENFERLDDQYFSLGTSVDYYQNLEKIGRPFKQDILVRLKDIALDRQLRTEALKENVTIKSLLRSKSRRTLEGQLDKAARNDYSKEQFAVLYQRGRIPGSLLEPPLLPFIVNVDSYPPTNVHVLIGRNGVGKSRCLTDLARSFVSSELGEDSGQIMFGVESTGNNTDEIASVITFSFSLFDMSIYKRLEDSAKKETLGYFHVGPSIPEKIQPDSSFVREIEKSLAEQFAKAISGCFRNSGMGRFVKLMRILENDPLLKSYEFSKLPEWGQDGIAIVKERFLELSSGHKIVCLILAELVAKVSERTLVIFDEPESHLHPPLLSSLIRAISELLRDQNGLAIIATHSPVVLQEVPASCVWVLSRQGLETSAVRPSIETFGEAVGTLTHDSFGLEARKSGFNSLIENEIEKGLTFDDVRLKFGGQLGSEARSRLRALSKEKE